MLLDLRGGGDGINGVVCRNCAGGGGARGGAGFMFLTCMDSPFCKEMDEVLGTRGTVESASISTTGWIFRWSAMAHLYKLFLVLWICELDGVVDVFFYEYCKADGVVNECKSNVYTEISACKFIYTYTSGVFVGSSFEELDCKILTFLT